MSWQQLQFVRVLGIGAFGEVQLVQATVADKDTRLLAVKTLRPDAKSEVRAET